MERESRMSSTKSARERSKPVSGQSCRNDRSIEASSAGTAGTERRKSSRGRKKISEVARRICILIRNLAESFLRSSSFPILFYTIPQSPKDRRRLLALLLSALPPLLLLLLFAIHIPVLFLPHYAGLAYPERRWTRLSQREVVFPLKMSIKATRRSEEKTRNGKLAGDRVSQAGSDSNLNFSSTGGNRKRPSS